MLIFEIFENVSSKNIAISNNGKNVTFGQLREKVKQYRDYYHTIGVKADENVGLYCKNGAEFIYAYFAVVSLGAVIVPINRSFTVNEIEYIAEDAAMKHLITMDRLDMSDKYEQLVINEYSGEIGLMDLDEAKIISDFDENKECVIIYTSGTTGHPKGAMLTHKNLISNAESTVNALEITSEDSVFSVLPMFHSFAWTVNVLAALYTGARIVVMENFVPKDAVRIISSEKVTVVTGVPAMFNYYLLVGSAESFSSIRLFVSGGASLPVEILENFKTRMGITILEGYGLSEASPVVSINPIGKSKSGSIGIPIKDVEVKVVDDDHNELPAGEKGELLVKGPNVMKGYYNLPEITEKTIINEWLHTGDVAYIDEDGYIFIVDRIKDIVIVSGLNVYPREIEEVIYTYEGIIEASVVGVPDRTRGEVVIAYIVVKDDVKFDLKGLKNYLRDNLASFKMPRKIILKDVLPKNATGKIMKNELRDEYLS